MIDVLLGAANAAAQVGGAVLSAPQQATGIAGAVAQQTAQLLGLGAPTVSREASSDSYSRAAERESEQAKRVFVVHGRDRVAYDELKVFLGALGLTVFDYDDQLLEIAAGAPSVMDIVSEGLKKAQTIVVLFTPDEHATLSPRLHLPTDKFHPTDVERYQARPNVIFEAGMAFGLNPKQTVLLALGPEVQLFSDAAGAHVHRLTGDSQKFRQTLASLLESTGCKINTHSDFPTAGDFEKIIASASKT
jgi:predicted nucleotide-binding protein